MASVTAALSELLGPDRLLPPDAIVRRATSFWNPLPTQARALLLPRSTDEVATILRWCSAKNQTVVIHGGLTGCVAGAESTPADVVVSLEKMNRVVEIDPVGGTAVVEAGAVLQQVQEAVAAEGLYFPLDLGARGSCTIGGNVATNAGGINVLKYGMMRNLVLGLEAVLADGTVVSSLNRMLKNNAGYDTKQLFIGSEGTLGIVTRAVLRLYPRPASRLSAMVAASGFDQVAALLPALQRELGSGLCAFEVMWGDYYAAVTGEDGHRAPLARDYPFYVVLQTEGSDPPADSERFERVLERMLVKELIVDAVVPKSEAEAAVCWRIREDFEAILKPQPVYLYDVSLPIRAMPAYVDQVKAGVGERWSAGGCYVFGHMADGNLHLFVQPNQPGDWHSASDEIVYAPLAAIGGSVSAEHGIGVEKLRWLPHSRSPAEIELMRTLKRALDPNNLLNRGRVLAT